LVALVEGRTASGPCTSGGSETPAGTRAKPSRTLRASDHAFHAIARGTSEKEPTPRPSARRQAAKAKKAIPLDDHEDFSDFNA